jgi:hypothetical protein
VGVVGAKGLGRYSAGWVEGGAAMGAGTGEDRIGAASCKIEGRWEGYGCHCWRWRWRSDSEREGRCMVAVTGKCDDGLVQLGSALTRP